MLLYTINVKNMHLHHVHNDFTLAKFNNWLLYAKIDLTGRYCVQYKRNSDKNYGCQPALCDRHVPKLCVTDNKGGQVSCSRIDVFR